MLDISVERKLQFFYELMESSNVGILVASADRKNIFVNQKTCDMFGYTEEELIGKTARIFHVSQESYEKFGELVLNTVLEGKKVALDYQWRRKDGTIFWGHISGSITQDSQEVLWTLFDVDDRKKTEEIQLKNHQQSQIIEQINEAVIMTDLQGNIVTWNHGAEHLFGYEADEIIGKNVILLYREQDYEKLYHGMEQLLKEKGTKQERTLIKKDGSYVDILLSTSLLHDENGNPTHFIGYAQDRTLIKKAEKSILQADMFYALVENAFIAIYLIKDGLIMYTNKKFQEIFGYEEEELLNKPSVELVHPHYRETVQKRLQERVHTIGLGIEYTFVGIKKNNQSFDAHVYGSSLTLDNGETAIIGMVTDDTKKNKVKKQLEILANKDALTQLYNRNYFTEQLQRALHLAQRKNHTVALIMFDIDNFKRVNDSLGHQAGDQVIQTTASRISKILRKNDMFFRIGGDEFTIIIEDYTTKDDLIALLHKIKQEMTKQIDIKNINFHISLSIGISFYPDDATTPLGLQKTADIAMYEAKSNGKNGFAFYTHDDNDHLNRAKLEGELFKAYDNNEFELYLQPQISSHISTLTGAEALIRWYHPQMGILTPDIFLKLAEDVGLLYKLDLFMLEEGLHFIQQNPHIKELGIHISINVSNALFMHQNFITSVEQLAQIYPNELPYIELELTEDITMKNEQYSQNIIFQLKKFGFHISIDDFGTGHSSLSHLKLLDVDELKIDKSFIDEIATNKVDKSIVKAIIDMSKALSLKNIAEGVETKEQLSILQELGCNTVQGYYYSKPIPKDEFKKQWLF